MSYNPSIGQGETFEILSEELLEIDDYLESMNQFKECESSERIHTPIYSSMDKVLLEALNRFHSTGFNGCGGRKSKVAKEDKRGMGGIGEME